MAPRRRKNPVLHVATPEAPLPPALAGETIEPVGLPPGAPADPWCKCGYRRSAHGTGVGPCKSFDPSWTQNGGPTKLGVTGAVVPDRAGRRSRPPDTADGGAATGLVLMVALIAAVLVAVLVFAARDAGATPPPVLRCNKGNDVCCAKWPNNPNCKDVPAVTTSTTAPAPSSSTSTIPPTSTTSPGTTTSGPTTTEAPPEDRTPPPAPPERTPPPSVPLVPTTSPPPTLPATGWGSDVVDALAVLGVLAVLAGLVSWLIGRGTRTP